MELNEAKQRTLDEAKRQADIAMLSAAGKDYLDASERIRTHQTGGCAIACGGGGVIAFEIDYPPTKKGKAEWNKRFGLNAYYTGKHWSKRKQDAKELHEIAIAAMRRARVPKRMVKGPVEVRFYWDDNLDCDNHASIGKAFLDAGKGWYLPDDNRRWVKRVCHEFWSGGKMRVEVLPYE